MSLLPGQREERPSARRHNVSPVMLDGCVNGGYSQPMSIPEALQHLTEAQTALDQIEADRAAAIIRRDEAITNAIDAGLGVSAIARHLGVSRQIIHRAIKRH